MAVTATATRSQNSIRTERFTQKGKDYIHFIAKGRLTFKESEIAIEKWKSYHDKNPDKKFTHIWDGQKASGIDNDAKKLWLKYMKMYRGRTEKIIMISDNIILRGVARILCRISNYRLSVYKTFEEMSRREF